MPQQAKTVYYLIGLPGSGKSYWAKAKIAEDPDSFVRSNKDLLRECLHCGQWSKRNEQVVLAVRDFIIEQGLAAGKSVIVDDTGFLDKHRERCAAIAKKHSAAFEVVDFTHVALETCLERNRGRREFVPEHIIIDMFNKYVCKPRPAPAYDSTLPDAVIIDVDGTLARMNGRGPFEWQRVGEDLPRYEVWAAAKGIGGVRIVVSGRDECCRDETEAWLFTHFRHDGALSMRPAGDMRKDYIVKGEIYEREINGKYNVKAIFDDRASVCRLWRSLGLGDRLFRVGLIDEDNF